MSPTHSAFSIAAKFVILVKPASGFHLLQASRRLKDMIDASNDIQIVIDLYEHGYLLLSPRVRPLPQVWTNFVRDQKMLLEGDASKLRHATRRDVPDYMITDGVMVKAGVDNPFFGPGGTSTLELMSFRYSGTRREVDLGVRLQKERLLHRIALSRRDNVLVVAEKVESSDKYPQ